MNLISAGRVDEASNVEFHLLFCQANVGPKRSSTCAKQIQSVCCYYRWQRGRPLHCRRHCWRACLVIIVILLLSLCYRNASERTLLSLIPRLKHLVTKGHLPLSHHRKLKKTIQQKTPWQLFNSHWMPHE